MSACGRGDVTGRSASRVRDRSGHGPSWRAAAVVNGGSLAIADRTRTGSWLLTGERSPAAWAGPGHLGTVVRVHHLGQRLEPLVEPDEQAGPARAREPALEGERKDGGGGGRGEPGLSSGDAAGPEGRGEGCGPRRALGRVPLLQVGLTCDDSCPDTELVATGGQDPRKGGHPRTGKPERGSLRCVRDPPEEDGEQLPVLAEEHLPLVGEVPEEGPLRGAGTRCEHRHGRVPVAPLGVQPQGRVLSRLRVSISHRDIRRA